MPSSLADMVSAATAAFGVAPFVCIIDRSIIKSANGSQKLTEGLATGIRDLVLRPHRFFRGRDFLLIWGVYSGTYIAANTTMTVCDWLGQSAEWPKFIATSAANILLGIRKDAIFTQMFGLVKNTAAGLPAASYCLFTLRDCLTIAASFNAPYYISRALRQGRPDISQTTADNAAQILCPMGVQFLSTPAHLLALDLYNNKGHTGRLEPLTE